MSMPDTQHTNRDKQRFWTVEPGTHVYLWCMPGKMCSRSGPNGYYSGDAPSMYHYIVQVPRAIWRTGIVHGLLRGVSGPIYPLVHDLCTEKREHRATMAKASWHIAPILTAYWPDKSFSCLKSLAAMQDML